MNRHRCTALYNEPKLSRVMHFILTHVDPVVMINDDVNPLILIGMSIFVLLPARWRCTPRWLCWPSRACWLKVGLPVRCTCSGLGNEKLTAPHPPIAELLFVGAGGTDGTNDCQTSATPCSSLSYALTKVALLLCRAYYSSSATSSI